MQAIGKWLFVWRENKFSIFAKNYRTKTLNYLVTLQKYAILSNTIDADSSHHKSLPLPGSKLNHVLMTNTRFLGKFASKCIIKECCLHVVLKL